MASEDSTWRAYHPPSQSSTHSSSRSAMRAYSHHESSYYSDSRDSPELSEQREPSTGPISRRPRHRQPESSHHSSSSDHIAPSQFPSPAESSAASQSPYPFYDDHASTSASNLQPGPASPALSVGSAYTSPSCVSVPSPRPTLHPPSLTLPPLPPLTVPLIAPQSSKQRKQRLFPVDRKAICEYNRDNPMARQEDIASRFHVERSTISKILKQKSRWLDIPEETNMKIAKNRGSKFPMIEQELETWLMEAQRTNTLLTDALIRNKAIDVAKGYYEKGAAFKASPGWVENFKQRHGIRGGIWHGFGKNTRAALATGANILPPLNISPSVQALIAIPPTSTTVLPPPSVPVQSEQVETIDEPDGSTTFVVPENYGRNQNMQAEAGPSNWAQLHNPQEQDPVPIHMPTEARYRIYTPLPDQAGPTMEDAERCIDTLIAFIDGTGPEGILSDDQRDTLTSIKHAFHNAQNGLPYISHS